MLTSFDKFFETGKFSLNSYSVHWDKSLEKQSSPFHAKKLTINEILDIKFCRKYGVIVLFNISHEFFYIQNKLLTRTRAREKEKI